MPRKPAISKVGAPTRGGAKGLAVKDGLRELRFNMKHGARKLVRAVEAATHREHATPLGPLALLGEPLNAAVRTTATLLSDVDHAAVDLLSADGQYRSMTVPLQSSTSYFRGSAGAPDLRAFTTDHHWRYRHWLAMNRLGDVFVHEQPIAMAGAQVAEAQAAVTLGPSAEDRADRDWHGRTAVLLVEALTRHDVLGKPALSPSEGEAEFAALSALGAMVVVLAGEIAPHLPHLSGRERYACSLRLADEIATADRAGWEGALRAASPSEAMGRWIAFVVRHV